MLWLIIDVLAVAKWLQSSVPPSTTWSYPESWKSLAIWWNVFLPRRRAAAYRWIKTTESVASSSAPMTDLFIRFFFQFARLMEISKDSDLLYSFLLLTGILFPSSSLSCSTIFRWGRRRGTSDPSFMLKVNHSVVESLNHSVTQTILSCPD